MRFDRGVSSAVRSTPFVALLSFVLVAAVGCGGGGGGGGMGGSSPTEPGPTVTASYTFTPDALPGGSVIAPGPNTATTDQVAFVIGGGELPRIASLELDVVYPADLLDPDRAFLHQWDLDRQGSAATMVSLEPGRWRIRLETPVSGSFSGSASLVEILFDYAGPKGSGRLAIQNIEAVRPNGTMAAGITGSGGELVVN